MIQERTMLNVADNSGAKVIQCIRILGATRRRYAQIGDLIIAVVKTAEPRRLIKKHNVVRAVVVRQRRSFRRKDGSYIRFDDNAAVVVDTNNAPRGGRLFGPMARELRDRGFEKIINLAPEVL
ncbi:MAG: 50S ribosomal protein L14 [Candidatus Nealsonbacteria bacterium RIFOXYB1_FULL_40_15]|uniref:Large ribosomal subunit protein uL14 n=2 Tax=Candidatus Nealsoniibacteriota TaxID=1817911 RepID=A0A1G2ELJ7_9BACT|nr:MAG: 50S ribosomal protein L14 [Candidatus Nealsonbacteria bacterium RIFOXYC1_FULL_40_7]OGZ27813.1 MAG: 50S ribosomal protein L14 [Candidatus Nealsonbacteria bacterium RIFOXYB1_FULL_40_15]OGZ28935.1 MAG: 50S ribosomal protein L14 [Candidatus Nealsonbacteria bacterium RIFOXYD1_FULL_39_11]